MEQFVNYAPIALAAACGSGDTSITVTNPSALPTTGTCRLVIDFEILCETSRSGPTVFVNRGTESTTAVAHALGAAVVPTVTAAALAQMQTDEAAGGSGVGIYGDSSDGTAICDGVATVAGMSLAGSVYTLTRDVLFASLTVNSGIEVVGAGWRLFAVALIHNGKIDNNGGDGTAIAAGTAGLGSGSTPLAGGGVGGFSSGGQGTFYSADIAGGGGNGGGSTSGGIPTYSVLGFNTVHVLPEALRLLLLSSGALQQVGGGSGGGSDAGEGGGGGGAGNLVVTAKTLTGSGSIQVQGGQGANAITTNGAGGGGGGVLTLATRDATGWTGTTSVAGGAGGAGTMPGVAGSPGTLLRLSG